jgi:YVTN family beta-propeller protein
MNRKSVPFLRALAFALATFVAAGSAAKAADRVYVPGGQWWTDWVDVVDPATNSLVTSVTVGTTPRGIAVSPDKTRVYVANQHSNNMSVLETAGNTVIATIPLGGSPFGVAVNPAGTRVYVTNIDDNTVSVIDTATLAVIQTIAIPGGMPPPLGVGPRGIAVNPAGTRVYVANWLGSSFSVIDATTNTFLTSVPLGKQVVHLTVNPAGTRLYVVGWPDISQPVTGPAPVFVVDTATNAVIAAPMVATAESVSVSPDGTRVYVPHRWSPVLYVLNAATNTVSNTVLLNDIAASGSLNPAGTKFHIVNGTQVVQTVDTTTWAVTSTSNLVANGATAFANSFVISTPAPCDSLSVTPDTLVFLGYGGTLSFQVNAAAGCKWKITGLQPWLSLSQAGGIGPVTVFLTAQPKPQRAPRGAILSVQPALVPTPVVPLYVYQN